MQHTPEQAAVIAAPLGNLLVSAAAGSGKTAVLTDRIVSRIMTGELDVRGVLVMTFTEAAARNMKDKIESKLRAALADTREAALRQRINRQLSLLPGAAISTIHAFCLDVIRNFYTCAQDADGRPLIEPGFRVDDGVEADLLLRLTLDEYLADQYEAIDRANSGEEGNDFDPERQAAFYRLIEGYGGAGGDQPVRELILHLHHFLRSLPDYTVQIDLWLRDLRAAADDFSGSPHMAALLRLLRLLLDRALDSVDELTALLAGGIQFIKDSERNNAYNKQFSEALQTLRRLDAVLLSADRDWDAIRRLTAGLADIDLPRASKSDSPEKLAFMELFCRTAAEVIHCLAGSCGSAKCRQHFIFKTQFVFSLSAAEIEADIAAQLPAVAMLFDLVLGLDRDYTRRKQIAGMIDFSDFEHLALTILRQDEARQYYRGRLTEVYVDEYQDTSSIQEEIIRAVSDDNCLMVGDIKQSIYRFRHARPRIFINRAQAYLAGSEGVLHELNKNFRSVQGILAAANDLFYQLMSTGAGEIDYNERHALAPHRPDEPDCPKPVTLLLINRQAIVAATEADEDETTESSPPDEPADNQPDAITPDDLNRYQQEALAIAHTMRGLHQAGTAWSDMVVLSRTRNIGQACREQLESLGIPVLSDLATSFLDTPVMRQIEALTHLLDNIRQDIPLAAVLRSELCQGGFNDEELLQIRLFARQQRPDIVFFHEAVLAYCQSGSDRLLRDRLAATLVWLGSLREQEQILSIGELIGLVFDQSGWLDRLAAQADGADKIRQLRQFQQWAEQFESRRPRGLHAFVSYIDSLRARGAVNSPFAAVESGEDAVRIMTIHSSKGLEFKVVFIIGTGYDLTPKDSNDNLMISENLGVGMDFADPEQQVRYPTHLKLAMLEELKAAGLAEELRLLYVAMTRAMDRLYIVGSVKLMPDKPDKHLTALIRQARAFDKRRQLPDYLVLAGKCYLDWLIMALARQPSLNLDWLACGEFPVGVQETPIWRLELRQFAVLQQETASWVRPALPPAAVSDPAALLQRVIDQPTVMPTDEMAAAVGQRIVQSYRFDRAARTPIKLTVSELKRREQAIELDPGDNARGISLTLHEWQPDAPATDSLAADQLGTLLHAFFRYIDLPAAQRQPDLIEIRRQLAAMRQTGMFDDLEAAALANFEQEFLAFVQSDLAAQMTRSATLHEEIPFTLALPATLVYNEAADIAADDKVLVQGIIDCWFEQDDGITLVDYKSDRLPAQPLLGQSELQNRYGLQLEYYARAIAAATGKPVTRRLIWLIRQGRVVELNPPEVTT